MCGNTFTITNIKLAETRKRCDHILVNERPETINKRKGKVLKDGGIKHPIY